MEHFRREGSRNIGWDEDGRTEEEEESEGSFQAIHFRENGPKQRWLLSWNRCLFEGFILLQHSYEIRVVLFFLCKSKNWEYSALLLLFLEYEIFERRSVQRERWREWAGSFSSPVHDKLPVLFPLLSSHFRLWRHGWATRLSKWTSNGLRPMRSCAITFSLYLAHILIFLLFLRSWTVKSKFASCTVWENVAWLLRLVGLFSNASKL